MVSNLSPQGVKKACSVERFNQTLKTKMWKYFTAKNTVHYLDVLPELVSSYNSTYHRSIKMAPNQVGLLSVGSVTRNLYGNVNPISPGRFNTFSTWGGAELNFNFNCNFAFFDPN